MIEFTVNAVPVPQPRPRAVKVGSGPNARPAMISAPSKRPSGVPHPIHAFKATVRHAAANAYQGPPLTGPLFVSLTFVLPRPQKREGRKHRDDGRYYHEKPTDLDNLEKSLYDALNELLWVDDGQIACHHVTKWVAAANEQPHVLVRVRSL